MLLSEKLTQIAEASKKAIPVAAQEIMSRSTQAVADSIAARSIPQQGDQLPGFSLANQNGEQISSQDLAKEGPLVVTFFRGKW